MQVTDGEVQELPVAADPVDGAAGQRRDGWFERLERRERHEVDPVDRAPDQAPAEVGDECMNLRKLWHPSSLLRITDIRHQPPAFISRSTVGSLWAMPRQ